MTKTELFRCYIYGYLNEKLDSQLQAGWEHSRKEYKKQAIVNYLKLDKYPAVFKNVFIFIAGVLELPLSLLIETYCFLLCVYKYIIPHITKEDGEYYFIGTKEERLKKILSNARIPNDKVVIVLFPGWNYGKIFEGLKQSSILSGIRLVDIWRAFRYSMMLSLFMQRKYGKNDIFFRSYSSFDFFLAGFYLSRLNQSKKVIYVETFSRWAFLYGHIPHYVVFLQHGIIGDDHNFLIKTGAPNEAYFLNEIEKDNCCNFLFNNNPDTHYLDGLNFTSNEKLLNNGKKDILIVCLNIYFELEKQLASSIIEIGSYNLYMKPHPLDPREQYADLCDRINAVLLEKIDYPKVDFVIAYNSTLAVEYRDAGIEVLRHDEISLDKIIEFLKNKI